MKPTTLGFSMSSETMRERSSWGMDLFDILETSEEWEAFTTSAAVNIPFSSPSSFTRANSQPSYFLWR